MSIIKCLLIFISLSLEAYESNSNFLRIAHRGAPVFAPENTLSSFLKAVELNANYLELDVHQTKDNVLVVIHDKTIDRTTNGSGKISTLTYQEILPYDAGSWFDSQFNNHKIPTLAEILMILQNNPKLNVIIEIKGDELIYPGIIERVINTIYQLKLENRTILKSFKPEVIAKFEILAPSIPRLYVYLLSIGFIPLTLNTSVSFTSPLQMNVDYLQEHYYFLTKKFVDQAHEKGFKVIAWGVDTKQQIKNAIAMGVDGIETDRLDLLAEIFAKN